MAPEVSMYGKVSIASDIWSLGILAVELAEGLPPYGETSPQYVSKLIAERPAYKLK